MATRVSAFDRANMAAILADTKCEKYDWFAARVLRLCSVADKENLELLRKAFPFHVEAFEAWKAGVLESTPHE